MQLNKCIHTRTFTKAINKHGNTNIMNNLNLNLVLFKISKASYEYSLKAISLFLIHILIANLKKRNKIIGINTAINKYKSLMIPHPILLLS